MWYYMYISGYDNDTAITICLKRFNSIEYCRAHSVVEKVIRPGSFVLSWIASYPKVLSLDLVDSPCPKTQRVRKEGFYADSYILGKEVTWSVARAQARCGLGDVVLMCWLLGDWELFCPICLEGLWYMRLSPRCAGGQPGEWDLPHAAGLSLCKTTRWKTRMHQTLTEKRETSACFMPQGNNWNQIAGFPVVKRSVHFPDGLLGEAWRSWPQEDSDWLRHHSDNEIWLQTTGKLSPLHCCLCHSRHSEGLEVGCQHPSRAQWTVPGPGAGEGRLPDPRSSTLPGNGVDHSSDLGLLYRHQRSAPLCSILLPHVSSNQLTATRLALDSTPGTAALKLYHPTPLTPPEPAVSRSCQTSHVFIMQPGTREICFTKAGSLSVPYTHSFFPFTGKGQPFLLGKNSPVCLL